LELERAILTRYENPLHGSGLGFIVGHAFQPGLEGGWQRLVPRCVVDLGLVAAYLWQYSTSIQLEVSMLRRMLMPRGQNWNFSFHLLKRTAGIRVAVSTLAFKIRVPPKISWYPSRFSLCCVVEMHLNGDLGIVGGGQVLH
jgi:hypothetical protein